MCKYSITGATREAEKDDVVKVGPVGSSNVIGFQGTSAKGGGAVCIKPETTCEISNIPEKTRAERSIREPVQGHFYMDNSALAEPEHYPNHEGFVLPSGQRLTMAELVGATIKVVRLPVERPIPTKAGAEHVDANV